MDFEESDDDDSYHVVIQAWIYEYYCFKFWEEFKSSGRLESMWMNIVSAGVCASPNIARPLPPDADQEKDLRDRLLIRLMFCLTKGTELLTGDDCTRLEQAMRAFERLVRLECVRQQLDDSDLRKMRILLKEQSVLECWRKGDYDLARAVCDRQYQFFEDCDVQKKLDKLNRALLQRNTDMLLSCSPYSDLIDFSKEVLKKVFDSMALPFLTGFCRRTAQAIRENEADEVDLQPSSSIETFSSSQLPNETQDSSANSQGVGIEVPDPDPVQRPSPQKTPSPSAAAGLAACDEPVIEIQSDGPNSDKESEDERPVKKIRESSLVSNNSAELKKDRASTSKAADCERELRDFESLFESDQEERRLSSRSKKRKKVWTAEEERDVYLGVKEFGLGNWRKIASFVGTGRSNVDVKDKWRNIEKQGKVKEYENIYGPY